MDVIAKTDDGRYVVVLEQREMESLLSVSTDDRPDEWLSGREWEVYNIKRFISMSLGLSLLHKRITNPLVQWVEKGKCSTGVIAEAVKQGDAATLKMIDGIGPEAADAILFAWRKRRPPRQGEKPTWPIIR